MQISFLDDYCLQPPSFQQEGVVLGSCKDSEIGRESEEKTSSNDQLQEWRMENIDNFDN